MCIMCIQNKAFKMHETSANIIVLFEKGWRWKNEIIILYNWKVYFTITMTFSLFKKTTWSL